MLAWAPSPPCRPTSALQPRSPSAPAGEEEEEEEETGEDHAAGAGAEDDPYDDAEL